MMKASTMSDRPIMMPGMIPARNSWAMDTEPPAA
jgi:hypothetical protein